MTEPVDVMHLLAESGVSGDRCNTCKWLATRPNEERELWNKALKDSGSWPSAQVARAMSEVKSSMDSPNEGSIRNHRSDHNHGRRS